jgi:hypothetical protein
LCLISEAQVNSNIVTTCYYFGTRNCNPS